MPDAIRPATKDDLQWLHNGFDEEAMRDDAEAEIRAALRATPTPSSWSLEDPDGRID
ncbi:MAG: hypothetical protein M3320_02635 [Actinomycetota bacterium]|nr:hypothetical protein [Actinomycetota bacterium]